MLDYEWPNLVAMKTKRTHTLIRQELVAQIDRLRQIKALEAASSSWKDKAHPELTGGAAAWVKTLRRDYERDAEDVTG